MGGRVETCTGGKRGGRHAAGASSRGATAAGE